jgi:putative ABC transport system substrate-binding protein
MNGTKAYRAAYPGCKSDEVARAAAARLLANVSIRTGALISYGFDLMGLFYDIASYVQRLAAGANPSDMPIEQSPRFYIRVNLKTAASLGVSLSDVFIARVNEVRE